MQNNALTLRTLRQLLLSDATGLPHLSAASGLWVANETLYVVADDELLLGVFALHGAQPGYTRTIIPGGLPLAAKPRKAAKPDFESLTGLPASAAYPYGALLALGSGSTEQRKRGMLWPFTQQEQLVAEPQLFDLQALYQPLEAVFADLNIEGVVVQGDCFTVWQRGNNQHRVNAVIEYPLAALYALLDPELAAVSLQPQRIDTYDLGEVAGVPLTFTDAYALADGGCVFTAAAENTDNSYLDGECVGAAIGLIDQQRQLRWLKPVQPVHKIEGISAEQVGDQLRVLLVSDADNRNIPAQLLETFIDYP